MTVDASPTLTPAALKAALIDAKTLFDARWLEQQGRKRPRDPAHLDPHKMLRTKGQIRHAIRHGLPDDGIHPVAESILVADRSLAEIDQKRPTVGSPLFYRVLTLADIARFRESIAGMDKRIQKLRGPEWKSALYELATACGYAASGIPVEFIEEQSTPTPDLSLGTDPKSYVECKAKLQYEQVVIEFCDVWMREALLPIKTTVHQHPDSFVIRVVILSPQDVIVYQTEIPTVIRQMIEKGQREVDVAGRFTISIERRPSKRETFPQHLPMHRTVWERALNFTEWDDWHYLSEDGEVALLNADPRFVTGIGKTQIVCVRAEYLRDNHVSLLNTLKDACRRQFAAHQPGIIHVLIQARLFALGQLRDPLAIKAALEPELNKVLEDYDRLWRIIIDVMSESDTELMTVSAHRIMATKGKMQTPAKYLDPQRILVI